jgi:predicted ATPase
LRSCEALLAARIDRLGERDKQVLQTAAVIGKDFSEPILQRVVGETVRAPLAEADLHAALRNLKDAEFVYEQALYPVVEYAFKHPLTQEVALRSQLKERRRSTHAAVARALEEVQAERLDETAALLAHHHEGAGEAGQAGPKSGVNPTNPMTVWCHCTFRPPPAHASEKCRCESSRERRPGRMVHRPVAISTGWPPC